MAKMDPNGAPAGAGSAVPSARSAASRREGELPHTETASAPSPAEQTPAPATLSRTGRLPHAARAVATPVMLILVLLGPVLGGLAYRVARDRQREQQRDHLEDQLAAHAHDLRVRTLNIIEVLHAVRSFFDCSELVTRDEFSRYTRDAHVRHPAMHAIEWVPVVPSDFRAAHERLLRDEGLTGYEIRERDEGGRLVRATAREAYFPVCYAEPM